MNGYAGCHGAPVGESMGKRTTTSTPSGDPKVRKKRRTLLGSVVRILAIVVVVLGVVFLASGWYFSNEIRDGALEPPTSEPPDYNWTVVDSASISCWISSQTSC